MLFIIHKQEAIFVLFKDILFLINLNVKINFWHFNNVDKQCLYIRNKYEIYIKLFFSMLV